MAGFVFRLQTLLNVKVQMENNLKNELGKAFSHLEHQKDIYRKIEAEKQEYEEHIKNSSSSGIIIGTLREYSSYISFLKDKMEFQEENIKKAKTDVDKYRERLIKAVQERKMLEKLREKKFEEYKIHQLKKEQQQIDELVSFKYIDRQQKN